MVKALNKGDYFTTKAIAEPSERQVWVRDFYDRSERKFWCYRFDDVNAGRYFRGDRAVFVEFTF